MSLILKTQREHIKQKNNYYFISAKIIYFNNESEYTKILNQMKLLQYER